VIAVSPLIGGKTIKGPADVVMADLDLGTGTAAVLAAYSGILDTLVIDSGDRDEAGEVGGVSVVAFDTRIPRREEAETLARAILDL
jgi:LPPG:FO 2-phospho-L-lactate transferase